MNKASKRTKNMNNILDLTGRILISLIFLLSGINKIGNYEGTVGWMESMRRARYFFSTSNNT